MPTAQAQLARMVAALPAHALPVRVEYLDPDSGDSLFEVIGGGGGVAFPVREDLHVRIRVTDATGTVSEFTTTDDLPPGRPVPSTSGFWQ